MVAKKRRTRRTPSKLSADVIETQAISLVDATGKQRAIITCGLDDENRGFTVVHLNDDQGRPRITLQVDDAGHPSIVLFTADNATAVSFAANSVGNGLAINGVGGCISLGVPAPEPNDPRGSGPKIDVVDTAKGRTWSVFEETATRSASAKRK